MSGVIKLWVEALSFHECGPVEGNQAHMLFCASDNHVELRFPEALVNRSWFLKGAGHAL